MFRVFLLVVLIVLSKRHIRMINSQESSSFSTTLPIGTIVLFGGPVIPENWLLCNGTVISRKIYSQLFDVIGTLYGPGDHTSTFNLPDFRGRFPLGQQSGFYQGGVSEVTLIEAELPSHTHDKGTLSIVEAGFHTHILQDPGHDHGGKTGDGPAGEGNRGTVSGGGFYDHNRHVHVIPRGVTSISVNAAGDHTHNVEGVTGSNGFGKCFPNHESLPNYQLHYLLQEYGLVSYFLSLFRSFFSSYLFTYMYTCSLILEK